MWKFLRTETVGYIVRTYYEYIPQPSIPRIVKYHSYTDQSTTNYNYIPTNRTYPTLDELMYQVKSG